MGLELVVGLKTIFYQKYIILYRRIPALETDSPIENPFPKSRYATKNVSASSIVIMPRFQIDELTISLRSCGDRCHVNDEGVFQQKHLLPYRGNTIKNPPP